MLDALKFPITAQAYTSGAFREIRQDLTGVKGALADVNERARRVARSMRNIGAGMTAGITAPLMLIGRESLRLYDTQLKAEKAVETAIASTGGAAGKTAQELFDMASALQRVSNYGDEEILQNVTAPLLTFMNIGADEFGPAQQAVLDMATLLDTDLKSAALQLGKALNDPVKGINALSRSGVSFTEEQQDMIRALVEGGNAAEAQRVMLAALQDQFGGQALAASTTPMGQIQQMTMALGDFKESLGEQIAPFLTPIVEKLKQAVDWFGALSPEVRKNIVVFGGLAAAAGPVVAGLGLVILGATALAGPVGLAALAIGGLAVGGVALWKNWDALSQKSPATAAAVEAVGAAFGRASEAQQGSLALIGQDFLAGIESLFSGNIIGGILGLGAASRELILMPFRAIDAALGGLSVKIVAWFAGLPAMFGQWATDFTAWGREIFEGFRAGAAEKWEAFRADLGVRWGEVKAQTLTWVTDFFALGGALIDQLKAGIEERWASTKEAITGLGGRVAEGFRAGITGAWASVKGAGASLVDWARGGVEEEAEIRSPSRLFARLGRFLTDGLVMGIESGQPDVAAAMDTLGAEADRVQGKFAGIGEVVAGTMGSIGQLIGEGIRGAKTWAEVLGGALKNIGGALLNSGIGGIGNAMTGAFGPMVGNLAQGLLGGLFGFANGGQFQVGGAGGTDSQLVAFKASPNETVTVTRPGQDAAGGGAVTVNFAPVIDARGADDGAITRMAAELQRLKMEIPAMVVTSARRAQTHRVLR